MSLCRYVLCFIVLTQCRVFAGKDSDKIKVFYNSSCHLNNETLYAIDMEKHVESAHMCGLNYTDLHCGYDKIAIKNIGKRFKDNTTCQEYPHDWTGCCKNNISDCTVFDTATRLNHRECSGEYKCTSFNVPESSQGTECHKMKGVSDYSVTDYYCVPDARSFEMCTNVRAAAHNQSIYVKNMKYPQSSYEVSCSCSIEVDSCTSGITMYTIDAELTATHNCTCLSNVTFMDEANNTIQRVECEKPIYNTITNKTIDERYIVIEARNPHNLTNISTSGMYFWYGFKAQHLNTSIELNCPRKKRRLCYDCGKPDSIRNGDLVYNSTSGGSNATVACYVGYKPNVTQIQCTRFGKWENATCNLADCGTPKHMANGYIFLDKDRSNKFGDYAIVLCDAGYRASSQAVQCLETGKWGTASCTINDCGRHMRLFNGTIVLHEADTSTVGSKAYVVCVKGYNSTTKSVTCQKDGSWSSALCLIKDCGPPRDIARGTVKVIYDSVTTYKSEARVTCDIGFTTDKDLVICSATGKWETSLCDDFSTWAIVLASVGSVVLIAAVGIPLASIGRRHILKRTYKISKERLMYQ